jgi:hypothetical protein
MTISFDHDPPTKSTIAHRPHPDFSMHRRNEEFERVFILSTKASPSTLNPFSKKRSENASAVWSVECGVWSVEL